MSWLGDDKSDDLWGDNEKKISWDDNSSNDFLGERKSLNLNFKFNPKIAGIVAGALALLLIGGSVLKGIGGSDSSNTPAAVPSASKSASPIVDLYTQPKMLQSFIDNALASAVTIYCGNYSGSGWAIDLSDDAGTGRDDAYPTEIITNNHVIEGCETSGVTIVPMGSKSQFDAEVFSYDRANDLAILMTDKYLPPLATIQPGNEVHVGQWVMAVGSPGAGSTTLDGSVTTGTVTNMKEGVVITDTTINPGNSGGPLLNAAGQVIAVVSAKVVSENVDSIGLARDVALICEQLNGCTQKQLLK